MDGLGRAGLIASLALVGALVVGASGAEAKTRAYISPGVGQTVYAETGKGSNERNDVEVGYDTGSLELIITDTRAGVKARDGCTQESATKARCPAAPGDVYYMYVATFGGDDSITLLSGGANPFPSWINTVLTGGPQDDQVRGGDSTDTVNGGRGDDLVGGGGGVDSLFGRPGVDRLRADDGVADQTINCGAGIDPTPVLDAGVDPEPESC